MRHHVVGCFHCTEKTIKQVHVQGPQSEMCHTMNPPLDKSCPKPTWEEFALWKDLLNSCCTLAHIITSIFRVSVTTGKVAKAVLFWIEHVNDFLGKLKVWISPFFSFYKAITCYKRPWLFFCFFFHNQNLYSLFFLHPSPLELHSQVWSRLCKAGTTGTEQREDTAEDGGLRLDWKSCEWQGSVMMWKQLSVAAQLGSGFQTFDARHTNAYLCLPADSVILFSSLWEDSSSCYHGSERELQVQWQHSEYS